MTAPAIPPMNGDTGSGKPFEMDAPMVANDADAARPVGSGTIHLLIHTWMT